MISSMDNAPQQEEELKSRFIPILRRSGRGRIVGTSEVVPKASSIEERKFRKGVIPKFELEEEYLHKSDS